MRNLLIIILAAAVLWLAMERHRLTGELETAKAAAAAEAEKVAATSRLSPSGKNPPTGWMKDHLDRGARALETPAKRIGH